jgi:predicted MFS family arabinose efflux permease
LTPSTHPPRATLPAAGSDAVGGQTAAAASGRGLTLAVLLAVFALNFMDRQILAILVEPIKREFALSDAEIGLLYGLAFAVVYSTVGIPIARWADRSSRTRIIAWSLALFSVMTLLCGLATSYWQLLLARVGVAVGEGGTNPPSHSMIADLYPLRSRSTAMALFALGPHIGVLLGFLVGGLVAQRWGWRTAFVVAGLAGLVVAALIKRVLVEPARGQLEDRAQPAGALPPARAVRRELLRHASMRHLFAGAAVSSAAAYAAIGWLPAFLIRSHGMSTSGAGIALALLIGVGGAVGTLAGGIAADRLGSRDAAWRLRVVAIALLVVVPCWGLALAAQRTPMALIALGVPAALLGFYLGPTFAMVQSLVEPGMRAVAAALLLLVLNLFGLGLGPLAVGLLSDVLQPAHGAGSLRAALLVVPLLCAWAAYHYQRASRTIAADLDRRTAELRYGQ